MSLTNTRISRGVFSSGTIDGFVAFGSGNTPVKIKTFTGTTAAAEGGDTLVAHGLTADRILSVNLRIENAANAYTPQEYTRFAEFQASVQWDNTNIFVRNSATNSGSILSDPFTLTVIYIE